MNTVDMKTWAPKKTFIFTQKWGKKWTDKS
jgi:hypothetical protein